MPMTREQFARALYQGLGRPILYARTHHTAPFADQIIQACLYNRIYDRQTDGGRALYLTELLAATGNESSFRAPILAALADPDEDMDEELLFDLALHFARGGDAAARHAMLARFLDNVSSGDATGAYQIAELDGSMGLRFVVEQAACEEERERRRQLRNRLGELSYTEVRAALEANLLSIGRLRRWGQQVTDVELRRAADDLLTAPESKLQERLLLIFDGRDFPGGHAPLLPFLDGQEHCLRLRAANALSRFRHPELRARALNLLAHVDTLEYGLTLLVGNHAPGDYAMFAARLQEPLDDDGLHAFVWRVHELFARAPALEATNLLLALYELGPCTQCREKIVADLIALGALPTHLAEECRFDANDGVRALVTRLSG